MNVYLNVHFGKEIQAQLFTLLINTWRLRAIVLMY